MSPHSKAIYDNWLAVGVTAWILGAIKAADGGVVHLKVSILDFEHSHGTLDRWYVICISVIRPFLKFKNWTVTCDGNPILDWVSGHTANSNMCYMLDWFTAWSICSTWLLFLNLFLLNVNLHFLFLRNRAMSLHGNIPVVEHKTMPSCIMILFSGLILGTPGSVQLMGSLAQPRISLVIYIYICPINVRTGAANIKLQKLNKGDHTFTSHHFDPDQYICSCWLFMRISKKCHYISTENLIIMCKTYTSFPWKGVSKNNIIAWCHIEIGDPWLYRNLDKAFHDALYNM
jgi:hypothetical protein